MSAATSFTAGAGAQPTASADTLSIGDLLGVARSLEAAQVERILEHQRRTGLRFGEAAVALGLVGATDVEQALARQFHYATATRADAHLPDELVVARQPYSAQAEVFRSVRAQLKLRLSVAPATERRALAVVSPRDGDGKTYFAANLAVACSQLGGRTLLIDADLRNPRVHQLFPGSRAGGLSHMLSGRDPSHHVAPLPDLPSLFVLAAGAVPPNPMELVEGPALLRLLSEVAQQFDHVIVDTPAFAHGMDAPLIAAACGASLVVLRRGRSALAPTQALLAAVRSGGTEVVGVVLNAQP
ncbi:MAG: polysaccharide biosynthesis tyrosine autokinase [Aquabacterium sp.]